MPDVVTMAKALGNGVPIGACWAKAEVAAVFEPGDHATTYGGQPLATAAARAVLAVMEAEDVPARAERAGARLRRRPRPCPGSPGCGASGCCSPSSSRATTARRWPPGSSSSVRSSTPSPPRRCAWRPSLLITDDEIDHAVDLLGEALS